MLRLMSIVASLALVHHLVLVRLLVNYFFVFEINVEQNQFLILIYEILGLVSRDIHAKCIVQFILKRISIAIVRCSYSATCLDLWDITGCVLLSCCLSALAIFDKEPIYVQLLIEKCEH